MVTLANTIVIIVYTKHNNKPHTIGMTSEKNKWIGKERRVREHASFWHCRSVIVSLFVKCLVIRCDHHFQSQSEFYAYRCVYFSLRHVTRVRSVCIIWQMCRKFLCMTKYQHFRLTTLNPNYKLKAAQTNQWRRGAIMANFNKHAQMIFLFNKIRFVKQTYFNVNYGNFLKKDDDSLPYICKITLSSTFLRNDVKTILVLSNFRTHIHTHRKIWRKCQQSLNLKQNIVVCHV